jgi:MATE family multidrug resistance protein
MGAGILVEVTGFSLHGDLHRALGTTPVAGHQMAANLVSLLFMLPLALANATSTLVAQRIGAGDDGRRAALSAGTACSSACAGGRGDGHAVFVGAIGRARPVHRQPRSSAAALPLLAWVALFHVADAMQTVAAFVLRAWRIATVPVVIYAVVALWGVGLGGGYLLAFNWGGSMPDRPCTAHAASGRVDGRAGLAASGLTALLAWVLRRQRAAESTA